MITNYPVNHPLAVKLWAKEVIHEATKQTWFGKFMGEGSENLIQVRSEMNKGPGDRVRVPLRMLLSGIGVQGDDTLEGNEEALTTYYQDTVINQLRHAVNCGGKMSQQRVPFDVRNEAKQGLADWWAERIDKWAANQLTGNTLQTDTRLTGNNAVTAPDSSHQIFGTGGDTSELSLSTSATHQFGLLMLDKAVVKARTLSPRIRPLRISGDEYYVVFLHPYQTYQMRTNTNTGQWLDIQKAAMAGIDAKKSPVFTGALGVYNQCIIHEAPYLPTGFASGGTTGSVVRGVFCGAQAAVMGYGQDSSGGKMDWNEKLFDYGNQLGVESGMIAGLQKTIFNGTDFATITLSSYSTQPT